MIRIVGGSLRGRTIHTPKTHLTRPGTELLRKAVFDICQNDIEGANFLDLFAGSGAFGIEAISRGAIHATFVDKGRAAIACIKKNISILGLEPQTTVFSTAYEYWYKKNTTLFDIAYASPPYPQIHLYTKLLEDFFNRPYAKIFYVESAKKLILTKFTIELKIKVRRYGDSYLYSFTME